MLANGSEGSEIEASLVANENNLRSILRTTAVNESLAELAEFSNTKSYTQKTTATIKEFFHYLCYTKHAATEVFKHDAWEAEECYNT